MNSTGPRMTLASIVSTRARQKPLKMVLYGPPGLGKSTFASQAPNPIFLCGEDGASFLNVKAFPRPLSWWDVLEAVQALQSNEHDYQTLVIDTLDGLETLCWEHVCRTNGNKKSIEELPYGKGYVLALEEWRKLLAKIEGLQATKGMNVILIAHAVAREFKDPTQEASWKRWDLRLHNKTADEISGWADAVLFGTHEALAKKEGMRVRGISTGERLMHTEWTAAYSAKNRYGLAPTLPLDWAGFWEAALPALRPVPASPPVAPPADPGAIRYHRGLIETLLPQLTEETRGKARAAYDAMPDDLVKLVKFYSLLCTRLEEQSSARRAREKLAAEPVNTTATPTTQADSSAA